jgi:hypothetical protein
VPETLASASTESPIGKTIKVTFSGAATTNASMTVAANWKALMRPYIGGGTLVNHPAQGVELTVATVVLDGTNTFVTLTTNEMTHQQPYRIFVSGVAGITSSTHGNAGTSYVGDANYADVVGSNTAKPTVRIRGPYLTPGVVIYTKSSAENSWQASESFTYVGPRSSTRADDLDYAAVSVNSWAGNEARVVLPNRAATTVVDIKAVLGSKESVLVGQYTYS